MSEETLIAGNTPTTDAAPIAAETVAPVAPVIAAEQQPPEIKTPEAKSEPEQKPVDKPLAPEKYEFKAPEGSELNSEVMSQFEGVAKELGLSQEAAQKVVDAMGPKIAAVQAAVIEQQKAAWTESARTDKEFGGEKLNENLSMAKKALDAFGTPELRTLLNETGLGNHPEIIRAFFKAGQKISSGNFVPGGAGSSTPDALSRLYPNKK